MPEEQPLSRRPERPDGDRRGMEPALLTVIQALHTAFVESHQREHAQAEEAQKNLEEERGATAREQDARYAERFSAQEKAVEVASISSTKALEAALASTKEAIEKSEIAQEKKSDATYVSIVKLQEAMGQVMPRAEAENRFRTQDTNLAELRDRLKTIEATKQGQVEQRSEMQMMVPWILAIISLAGLVIAILTRVTVKP
jgi:cobalamin biosynthesis Mg chelatase CobN